MSEQNIGDLLPIAKAQIGAGLIETTSARGLHAYLEVGKDFTTWIKGRIEAYQFVEGQDYVTDLLPNFGEKGQGRPTTEYHLTLDMAKELAMVERNAKGKEARRYFIQCEQIAKGVVPPPPQESDEITLSRALLLAVGKIDEAKQQIALLEPKAAALDRLTLADGDLTITEAAKALGARPKDLFLQLQQNGWIYKRPGAKHWLGYQARVQSGLLTHKVTTISRSDGSEKIVEQVLVTPKGLTKLAVVEGLH